jgi:hypothetical protein
MLSQLALQTGFTRRWEFTILGRIRSNLLAGPHRCLTCRGGFSTFCWRRFAEPACCEANNPWLKDLFQRLA